MIRRFQVRVLHGAPLHIKGLALRQTYLVLSSVAEMKNLANARTTSCSFHLQRQNGAMTRPKFREWIHRRSGFAASKSARLPSLAIARTLPGRRVNLCIAARNAFMHKSTDGAFNGRRFHPIQPGREPARGSRRAIVAGCSPRTRHGAGARPAFRRMPFGPSHRADRTATGRSRTRKVPGDTARQSACELAGADDFSVGARRAERRARARAS